MTTLPDRIRSGEVEAPDVFCGGTPCQAFSVAGLRKSLDDARGNLSLTFCEIADAIDQVRLIQQSHPSIVFWENVPGVLNTKDNAFGCFLGALAGEDDALIAPGGRWTNAGFIDGPQRAVAWRVFDAQYFGVAQRRRRVFVVASARNDFDPATVLFEFEGVRRDIAPSREARKVTPTISSSGTGVSRVGFNCEDEWFIETPVVGSYTPSSIGEAGDPSPTLTKNHSHAVAKRITTKTRHDAETETLIPTYAIQGSMIGRSNNAGPQGNGINEEICFTQNTTDRHAVAQPIAFQLNGDRSNPGVSVSEGKAFCLPANPMSDRGQAVAQPIPLNTMTMQGRPSDDGRMGSGIGKPGDPCPTLTKGHSHAVAAFKGGQGSAAGGIGYDEHVSPTLSAANSGSNRTPTLLQAMAVRRLTPTECERLQGFPDNYTNIHWRGKPDSPDGPRYKALGNSWAVPVVRWIGERIARAT
jgi:DNA (cytosine-5)-methyltransferase 1